MAAGFYVRFMSLAAATLIALAPAMARADDNFFAGKTLTLYAGYPPGGGVDGEMRLVAKYLPRHIPGNSNLIAKNMPGAGGAVLGNNLYNVAEKTGLVIGMPGRASFLLTNVVPQNGINYDLSKFSYIGAAGSTNSILWLRKQTGITTVDDLRKAKKEIVLGALAPRGQTAIVPKVLAKYKGWPFKVVHGYRGTSELLIAVERGEVDGLLTIEAGIQSNRPDLIETKAVVPVFQTFEELPGVPTMSDFVSNADEKALLEMLNVPMQIGMPLLAPPAVPEDRLATLRAAYVKMIEDPGYRDEAEKKGVPVGRPISGPDIQKLVASSLTHVPEPVVKEYLAYTEDKDKKQE